MSQMVTMPPGRTPSGSPPDSTPPSPQPPPIDPVVERWVKLRETRSCMFNMSYELTCITELIEKRVPMAFLRVGDGEYMVANGVDIGATQDTWVFKAADHPQMTTDLRAALSHAEPFYYYGLPCMDWNHVIEWNFNLSPGTRMAEVSYALAFIDGNYLKFSKWFAETIVEAKKVPTVLIANDNALNQKLTWPIETVGFPTRAVEMWKTNRTQWLDQVSLLSPPNLSSGPSHLPPPR